MNPCRLLRTILIALILAGPTALAVPKGATIMGGDSNAQVVLENGTIGVLKVRAVYEAQDGQGCKTLYLVADEKSFNGLTQIVNNAGGSVTISLTTPPMQVVLRLGSSRRTEILVGHLVPTGERVFVLTTKAADRWH
jgi:hypothetical protein